MKKIRLIIFDCDGVIFDSKKANEAYYNTLLAQFKLPKMSNEQIKFIHAHTVDDALGYLIKDRNLIKQVQNYRYTFKYDKFIKLMKIEPTLTNTLKKLHSQFKIALATNRTNTVKAILDHHKISTLFDFVICASDVKFPKPNPEMLNRVIKYFNVQAEEAIYIGDSKVDEEASYSAKIPFVSYNNANLSASVYITSISMLESIISV